VAARLYGAADAQRESFGLPIEPQYQAEYERDVAVARSALGDAAFVAARSAGHALGPEQAVAEALSISIPATAQSPAGSAPSAREIEVLRLLATGLSDREIAEALFIGERTVNTHVARLYAKLGVRNRATAVSAAIAAGFVDPATVVTREPE
jgi:DNA-binding NarL/FixJ family response regulator